MPDPEALQRSRPSLILEGLGFHSGDTQDRVSKLITLLCGHYFLPVLIHLLLQPIFVSDDG